jgi:hypothetical protein
VIQQLQQRIADLELRIVPETPQDVRDQREETARSTIERLKTLTGECKQLSNHSAHMYDSHASGCMVCSVVPPFGEG